MAVYCRKPFINLTHKDEKELKKWFKAIKDKYCISGVDFLEAI